MGGRRPGNSGHRKAVQESWRKNSDYEKNRSRSLSSKAKFQLSLAGLRQINQLQGDVLNDE